FQLILAANACPCGRLGSAIRGARGSKEAAGSACFCSPDEIRRHWRKLGSALLDRIELRVPVCVPGVLVPGNTGEEKSAVIAARVLAAVEIQRERFKASGIRRNSHMPPGRIETFCPVTDRAREAFSLAAAKLGLSGRACHGILKTARTIADLEGKDTLDTAHILEAVQHRRFGDDPYDIIAAGEQAGL
ncbi:MAG: ATP-binding protein, partial [Treponema sp.]|nr:ATP-binding protein [Treponema sp.]